MTNPSPYRGEPIEKRVERVENMLQFEVAELEKRTGRHSRALAVIIIGIALCGAFLVTSVLMKVRGCTSAAPKHHESAAVQQRRADERTCDGVSMDYVARYRDSLLCSRYGEIITFTRNDHGTSATSDDELQVTRSRP